MKITSSQLKKIIAEEIKKVVNQEMDPDLRLIDNQLNGDPDLAKKVLISMAEQLKTMAEQLTSSSSKLPYMQAIEAIKMLSEKMPGKFDETLQKLKKS
jgi:hypothetical protein